MYTKNLMLVFFTGLLGMVCELAGARLLIPFYGDSTVVWSCIISTFMAGVSVGYLYGGILADRNNSAVRLSHWLTGVACFSAFTLFLNPIVCIFAKKFIPNEHLSALSVSFILFMPSSIVLGMIFPYVVKTAVRKKEIVASSVGKITALSTIGSIAGTLLAGFWLIPHIGTTRILYSMPLALICIAIYLAPNSMLYTRLFFLAVIVRISIFPTDSSLSIALARDDLKSIDSQYSRYLIYNSRHNNRPTVNFSNDPSFVQSSKYLDAPDEVVEGTYAEYFDLGGYFHKEAADNVLMLGAGGFVYPEKYAREHPDSQIDVVELDPAVVSIAEDYFGYSSPKNISLSIGDARQFIENSKGKQYDVVFLDVFSSNAIIPFHLTTDEFFTSLSKVMSEDGTLLFNVVSAVDGGNSRLFQSIMTTLKNSFPNLYVFPIEKLTEGLPVQNIIIVAEKQKHRQEVELTGNQKMDKLLRSHNPDGFGTGFILTDDFAPVQYMVSLASR